MKAGPRRGLAPWGEGRWQGPREEHGPGGNGGEDLRRALGELVGSQLCAVLPSTPSENDGLQCWAPQQICCGKRESQVRRQEMNRCRRATYIFLQFAVISETWECLENLVKLPGKEAAINFFCN